MKNTTLVTGIWDLGRSELGEGWSRSFDHYVEAFKKLLSATQDHNLAIFIDEKHQDIVWDIICSVSEYIYLPSSLVY